MLRNLNSVFESFETHKTSRIYCLVTQLRVLQERRNQINYYQYIKTNVVNFLLNLLRIKGLCMFRALLSRLQEALHRRHLVYCVSVTSYSSYVIKCGPGSSVGIATGFGLDGPGIEYRWGRDFSHTSRPALGPTQPPVQWVPSFSRG
jgi:hypothetical protein